MDQFCNVNFNNQKVQQLRKFAHDYKLDGLFIQEAGLAELVTGTEIGTARCDVSVQKQTLHVWWLHTMFMKKMADNNGEEHLA